MKPVQYIFLNKGLGMSPGKLAAQAGHAAVEGFRLSHNPSPGSYERIETWLNAGFTKLAMEAESEVQLLIIQRYIEDAGYRTKLIIDEGRTEIRPHTATALAVELVDKDDPHVQLVFGNFRLYRDERKASSGRTIMKKLRGG